VWRRGKFSKKLSNWVIEIRPNGIHLRLNVVRFDKFFHGRCVITPARVSTHSDERSPSKNASLRTVSGESLRLMFSSLRRGARRKK